MAGWDIQSRGGMRGRGHAWQWVYVTGGGSYVAVGVHHTGACMAGEGACIAGETATAADGTHPTGMHSCLKTLFV